MPGVALGRPYAIKVRQLAARNRVVTQAIRRRAPREERECEDEHHARAAVDLGAVDVVNRIQSELGVSD